MTEKRSLKGSLFKSSSSVSDDALKRHLEKLSNLQRTATSSKLIQDTFQYLEAVVDMCSSVGGFKTIAKDSWRRNNAKVWQHIESHTFKWILMMVFQTEQNGDKSWSQVFYEYRQLEEGDSHNILLTETVNNFHQLLSIVTPLLTPDMQDSAEEICNFFATHKTDPYSCVIGQRPSKEILVFSQNISDDTLNRCLAIDLGTGELSKRPSDYKNRFGDVISMLVYWSTLPEEETLRHVYKAASAMRGIHMLEPGSLVLANLDQDDLSLFLPDTCKQRGVAWRFARVAGYPSANQHILLYRDPAESSVVSVPFDRVLPVAPEMLRKYFDDKKPLEMSSAVVQFSTILCEYISDFARSTVKEYLTQGSEATEALMKQSLNTSCHLENQKEIARLLEMASSSVPEATMTTIIAFSGKVKAQFEENRPTAPQHLFFQPTKDADRQMLLDFDATTAINQEMQSYQSCFRECLNDLLHRKEEILTGKRKNDLSASYLSKISGQVNIFLEQLGYDLDAIPSNYLDVPPRSILAVRRNLVLLRRILKNYHTCKATGKEHDPFKLKPMISDLATKTYAAIDEFLRDLHQCLAEQLDITYEECCSLTLVAAKERLQQCPHLSEELKEQIEDAIMDKYYLSNMKAMENDIKLEEKLRRDVIPVSGLVISKLSRLENECKSVLDLWEAVRIPKTTEESRTPLENAVIKSDMKALDSLLKGSLAYINDRDANGWTALHLSCSFCFNEHRLPVTSYLLSFGEIDIVATNNFGNTPVHLLARMPVEDQARPLYRECLRKMLENPETVYCENTKGETPLHMGALAHNAIAVRFLLEAGSDPNFGTKEGNTPLHYAVKSTNVECVTVLLSYASDFRLKNEQGETAADIALKLNLVAITELLHLQVWDGKKTQEALRKAQLRLGEIQVANRVTELPTLSPANVSAPEAKNRSLVSPRRSTISDPAAPPSGWKRAPLSDSMRSAMMSMADSPLNLGRSSPPSNTSQSSISPRIISPRSAPPISHSPREASPGATSPRGVSPRDESPPLISPRIPPKPIVVPPAAAKRRFCRVVWDIIADEEDELDMRVGDLVEVVREDPSGWWFGRFNGREGTFPLNYTVEISDEPQRVAPPPIPPKRVVPIPTEKTTETVNPTPNESSPSPAPLSERSIVRVATPMPQQNATQIPSVPANTESKETVIIAGAAATGAILQARPRPQGSRRGPSRGAAGLLRSDAGVSTEEKSPPNKGLTEATEQSSPSQDITISPIPKGPIRPPGANTAGPRGGATRGRGGAGASRRQRPLPNPDSVIHAITIADFEAETPQEITLAEGSLVIVVKKHDDGWWLIKCKGQEGFFPASYLEERSISAPAKTARLPPSLPQ